MELYFGILTFMLTVSSTCCNKYAREELGVSDKLRFTSGANRYYNCTVVNGFLSSNLKIGMFIHNYKPPVYFYINDTDAYEVTTNKIEDFYFANIKVKKTVNEDNNHLKLVAKNKADNAIIDETMLKVKTVATSLAPTFKNSSTTVINIKDNLFIGSVIGKMVVNDNIQEVVFSMASHNGQVTNEFSITVDGRILLTRTVNVKLKDLYEFSVIARSISSHLQSSVKVKVNIQASAKQIYTYTKFTHEQSIPTRIPKSQFKKTFDFSFSELSPTSTIIGCIKDSEHGLTYSLVTSNMNDTFVLNKLNGYLSVKDSKKLDYEKTHFYQLLAVGKNIENIILNATINLHVQDANDNAPIFSKQQHHIAIEEDIPVGSDILKLLATDSDSGINGKISFVLANEEKTPFYIEGDMIKVGEKINLITMNDVVILYVKAVDWGNQIRRETEVLVTIDIKAVNSHKPVLKQTQCNISVSYDNLSSDLITFDAADEDISDHLVFRLKAGSEGYVINATSGRLTFINEKQMPKQKSEILYISVSDGIHSSEDNTVIINFGKQFSSQCNINAEYTRIKKLLQEKKKLIPPTSRPNQVCQRFGKITFLSQPKSIMLLSEDSPLNTILGTFLAADSNDDCYELVMYTIVDGNDGRFQIDLFNGTLYVFSKLDREERYFYSLKIKATSLNGLSTVASVLINIQDVNDNAPVFSNNGYYLFKDQLKFQSRLKVSATDPDEGSNGEINYSLVNPSNMVSIDEKSGILRLLFPLEELLYPEYVFEIKASDKSQEHELHDYAIVHLVLNSTINQRPSCLTDKQQIEVAINTPVGCVVGRVFGYNTGFGLKKKVTYTIIQNSKLTNFNDYFELDSNTGLIKLKKDLSQKDKGFVFNIQVKVHVQKTFIVCHVYKIIVDAYGAVQPEFINKNQLKILTLSENAGKGAMVTKVSATLTGTKTTDHLRYELVDGSGIGVFSIVKTFGNIYVARNEFSKSFYWLTVQAYVGLHAFSNTHILIRIKSSEARRPFFSPSVYHVTMNQPVEVNHFVVQLFSSNGKQGFQRDLKYSIYAGNDGFKFVIKNTGRIYTQQKLLVGQYKLNVTVSSQLNSTLISHGCVTVDVYDKTSMPPQFLDKYEMPVVHIFESKGSLHPPFLFQSLAINPNNFEGDKLIYDIAFAPQFTIDPKTAVLKSNHDFSAGEIIFVTVNVKNTANQTASVGYSMEFIARPAKPTKLTFKNTSYTYRIEENVGNIPVIDFSDEIVKSSSGPVSFYIISGNEGLNFAIPAGRLTLLVLKALNYEWKPVHTLKVLAFDGYAFATTEIFVHVVNVKDNSLTVSQPCFAARISENTRSKGNLIIVKVTDPDGIDNSFNYILMNNVEQNSPFAVSNGGILTVKADVIFDREEQEEHMVTIVAGSGNENATYCVKVEIEDMNDHSPNFTESFYTVSLLNSISIGSSIIAVYATDDDSGSNADLTYSLPSLSDFFGINSKTGVVFVKGNLINAPQEQFVLDVLVVDGGTPSFSAHTKVKVDIIPDLHSLKFKQALFYANVSENMPVGSLVSDMVNINVSMVNYEIFTTGDGCVSNFWIDQFTGILLTTSVLDAEKIRSCSFGVHGLLHGRIISSTDLFVSIVDRNDNKPVFLETSYNGSIVESQNSNSKVATALSDKLIVTATDVDTGENGVVKYSLLEKTIEIYFHIDEDTGEILSEKVLDYENGPHTLKFHVKATDQGSPANSAIVPITVVVKNINDQIPKFEKMDMVSFLTPVYDGTILTTVTANDDDMLSDSQLIYSLDDSDFNVHPTTGIFSVKNPSALKNREVMSTEVSVSDGLFTSKMLLRFQLSNYQPNPTFRFVYDTIQTSVMENLKSEKVITALNPIGYVSGEALRFRILNPIESIQIGKTSGVLKTVKNKIFDRETKENYMIYVEAWKAVNNNVVARTFVNITVIDVNDNAPVFAQEKYDKAIDVDTPVGTQLLVVIANDADIGENGDIRYEIIPEKNEYFDCNETTGAITLKKMFVKSHNPKYSFKVKASDNGNIMLSSVSTVELNVINKDQPMFTSSCSAIVSEDAQPGQHVFQIQAKGQDERLVYYQLSKGDDFQVFNLGFTTGDLSLSGQLDYSLKKSYHLILMAIDSLTGSWSEAECDVIIRDINNNYPLFEKSSYEVVVPEDSLKGYYVLRLNANDRDDGANADITYSITAQSKDSLVLFSIDASTGVISLFSMLDAEAQSSHLLYVTATDGGIPAKSSFTTVSVHVKDVNDNSPIFLQSKYEFFIDKYTGEGSQFVGMVHALDADISDELTYKLVTITSTAIIDPVSGAVFITSKPNSVSVIKLRISATDSKNTAFAEIEIRVNAMNYNSPVFCEKEEIFVSEKENTKKKKIFQLMAKDGDVGTYGEISYQIDSESVMKYFYVDNGFLYTTGRAFDREQINQFVLPIRATDAGGLFSLCEITVKIQDENDNAPIFEYSFYEDNVLTSQMSAESLLHVIAHDMDEGSNAELTYTTHGLGADGDTPIIVNRRSGLISLAGSPRGAMYQFSIRASDNGFPLQQSKYADVRIAVKGWSDRILSFTNDSYYITLNELTEVKKSLITVQANIDNFNGTIKYSLVDGNLPFTKASGYFKINPKSGKIKLRMSLEYKKIKMHKIMVRAVTDDDTQRAMCFVHVHVNNIQNIPPTFNTKHYKIYIAESVPSGKQILQVSADDLHPLLGSPMKYKILSGDTNLFSLDELNGWLKVMKPLDRETKPIHQLQILAVKNVGNSDSATVSIHLVDVNDSPPKFSQDLHSFQVKEDTLIGQDVGVVQAIDADVDATIRYFVETNSSKSSFSIDTISGQIKVLHRLTLPLYVINVTAYDGVHRSHVTVTIVTIDVNNHHPHCLSSYYDVHVRENEDVTTPLLRIEAVDADPSDSLKYLIQGDGVGKFRVNETTGLLSAVEVLDRESYVYHNFKVVVADKAGHTCMSDVFITVLDANDNSPIFTRTSYSTTVRENSIQFVVLSQVKASDLDSMNNRKVTYVLQNNKDNIFNIGAYGIISLSKPALIDQKKQAKHSLVVVATDEGQPSLSAVVNLEVIVLTVADTPPQFKELGYLFMIKEDAHSTTNVGDIDVKVADGLVDRNVIMELLNDHDNVFTLKNNKLQLAKHLDYETKTKYSFSVKAWFKKIPSLSSLVNIEVQVLDANDHAPVFLKKSYFKQIDENVRTGTFVLQTFATDADGSKDNSHVVYNMMSDHVIPFSINAETGVLVVNGSIDHEVGSTYTFHVIAEDNGTPKLSSKVQVTINITDLNDNAPVISDYNTSLIIHEGKLPGSTLLKLSVTDKDSTANADPFFCMLLNGDESMFVVHTEDRVNCVIQSKKVFDMKTKKEYELLIRVTDSGTPKRYSDSKVKVFIVEESYYAPVIQDPKIFFVIVSQPYGVTKIGEVRVFDKDPNDIHQYKISAGNVENYFSLQQMSGVIEGKPERGSYSLSIEVSDGKYSDSSLFKIIVHELVEEVYVKSLQITLNDIDAKTFIENKMIEFIEVVAAVSGRSMENVFIWSIQNIQQTSTRQKRSLPTKMLIAMAVQNPSDLSYMNPKELQNYMTNSKDRFDDVSIDMFISDSQCSSKSCPTSQKCAITLTPSEEIISLYTPSGYMTFIQEEKCYCSDWSEGIGTECILKNFCASNPCKSWEKCVQTGVSFKCECVDLEKCATTADNGVTLDGASYVSYGLRKDFDELFSSLSIGFRTESKTSFLFYAYGKDFFIVEVELGYIKTRFDFGSGVGSISIKEIEVSDGNWHSVRIERSGNYVSMTLDHNKYTANGRAPGNSAKINIKSNSVVFGAGVTIDGTPFSGFKGCIKDLKLNKKLLPFSGSNDIVETIDTLNIKYGCKDSGLCSIKQCPTFSDCINTFTSYKCVCLPGHHGSSCTSKLTCVDRPCKNNGVCTYQQVNGVVVYKCTCKLGYTGAQCRIDLQACASRPCLNDARCIALGVSTYKCECKTGFSGENCQINKHPCSPNPCYNGGICVQLFNDYKCECPADKKGSRCAAGEYCEHVKCANGGRCYELRDGARCICHKGFTGPNCNQDINECLRSDTCKNGGTCINTWGSNHCNCTFGVRGTDCANASRRDEEGFPLLFIIVGVAVVLFLIIVIGIIVCCCKKRKKSYQATGEDTPERKYPLDRYQREHYELAELFPPNPPPRGFPAPPAYYVENDNDQASAAMYDPSIVTFSSASSPTDGMMKMKFSPARTSVEYNSDDEDMRYHWDYSEVPEDVINNKMSREGSRIGLTKTDQYYPDDEFEYVDIPQVPERPASRRSSLPGFSECDNDMPQLPALPQQVRLSRQSLRSGNQSPSTLPRLPPDLSTREFNNRYSLLSDENEPNTSYFHDMLEGETVSDITNVTHPYKKPYILNDDYESEGSDVDDRLDGLTETSFNSDDDCATETDPLDPENTRQLERDIKKLIKDLQKRTEEDE